MRSKLLADGATRTYVLVFDTGDEAMNGLTDFAKSNGIDAASVTAVGALRSATLAYFDIEQKQYHNIPVDEQTEVLTLAGDITRNGDDRQVHVHAVLGRRDGTTRGGHVKEAYVRPTLEVMLTETPPHLWRSYDEKSGLALIDLDATS